VKRGPAAPPKIRGFEHVRHLASGGFSDVYLYQQHHPSREVAVKVLKVAETDEVTEAAKAAFIAEANVMAKLSDHPYIVSILLADVADDGRPYLIMDYYGGASLNDRYRIRPLSVPEALRCGVRIASAVALAHSAGILHRDIKPANILTNQYDWPGLTDFGISTTIDDELAQWTTAAGASDHGETTGQSVGMSVPWSPPEVVGGEDRQDVRSDVFSLAATLYTLLAGRTPFEIPGGRNQSNDLIARIVRGDITPMNRPEVPDSLIAVLNKGMANEPRARYATALEFARALQNVELDLHFPSTPVELPGLSVPEIPRNSGGDPSDETRGRIVSVEAQPVRLAPASAPPATRVIEADTQPKPSTGAPFEGTIIRKRAESAPETAAPPIARSGRRLSRGLLIGVPVVLGVIAAVTVAVLVGSSMSNAPQGEPTSAEIDDGGPIVVSGVPSPVDGKVEVSPDGTQFTFSWSNPDPADGDQYLWQQIGLEARHPVSDTTAVVTDAVGTNVCILVSIVRDNGAESAAPLRVCVR
jgi:serine/threonine protein kinase